MSQPNGYTKSSSSRSPSASTSISSMAQDYANNRRNSVAGDNNRNTWSNSSSSNPVSSNSRNNSFDTPGRNSMSAVDNARDMQSLMNRNQTWNRTSAVDNISNLRDQNALMSRVLTWRNGPFKISGFDPSSVALPDIAIGPFKDQSRMPQYERLPFNTKDQSRIPAYEGPMNYMNQPIPAEPSVTRFPGADVSTMFSAPSAAALLTPPISATALASGAIGANGTGEDGLIGAFGGYMPGDGSTGGVGGPETPGVQFDVTAYPASTDGNPLYDETAPRLLKEPGEYLKKKSNDVGGKIEQLLEGLLGPLQVRENAMYGGYADGKQKSWWDQNSAGLDMFEINNNLTTSERAAYGSLGAEGRNQLRNLMKQGRTFAEALAIVRRNGKTPPKKSNEPPSGQFPSGWNKPPARWPDYVKLPWAPTPTGLLG